MINFYHFTQKNPYMLIHSPKHRLIVLTDITSLTPTEKEPDDAQSMIRLMLYSNEIEIEGLIASSNLGHGQITRPDLIERIVAAYQKVHPNLLIHDPNYPDAEYLFSRIKDGQPIAGQSIPFEQSIGKNRDTSASNWIIQVIDRPDPRPVWVAVWGGTADLAQALWRARNDRTTKDFNQFLRKIRVHAIADQDRTAVWIKDQFPGLFYIRRTYGFRGMYRGGDTYLSSSNWVQKNLKNHGELGDLYPDYQGGDIWSKQLGQVRGIKEGDTPSYLGLIRNGLNPTANPLFGDWGGRCQPHTPLRYEDAIDPLPSYEVDPAPQMATVYRWRSAFQADFAARMDWCIYDFGSVSHSPCIHFLGEETLQAVPGEKITVDASPSFDPNGKHLHFSWSFYREASSYPGYPIIESPTTPITTITIPSSPESGDIHILLTVTNDGDPPLSSYQRLIIRICN